MLFTIAVHVSNLAKPLEALNELLLLLLLLLLRLFLLLLPSGSVMTYQRGQKELEEDCCNKAFIYSINNATKV